MQAGLGMSDEFRVAHVGQHSGSGCVSATPLSFQRASAATCSIPRNGMHFRLVCTRTDHSNHACRIHPQSAAYPALWTLARQNSHKLVNWSQGDAIERVFPALLAQSLPCSPAIACTLLAAYSTMHNIVTCHAHRGSQTTSGMVRRSERSISTHNCCGLCLIKGNFNNFVAVSLAFLSFSYFPRTFAPSPGGPCATYLTPPTPDAIAKPS